MADLGRELELLKKDVGTWEAAITVTPQPGAAPQESTGRMVGRLISGGRWLVTEFKNQTTGFEGHGIYGYNAAKRSYVGAWVDDMRSDIYVGDGQWDEASQTMTYSWSTTLPNGQAMKWKETTARLSENERIFRVVFPTPDGGEFEMMRALYRRA
jgi:hypothetical protein